jgi:AcrR family transcriptional regulator
MLAERWALPARQERSRATRTRILAAAERVFAEKGYDGARLSDIAAAAGCSVGTMYFRFKDKDALFFAIAESFAADARARLEALLSGTARGGPREIVEEFVRATAANFRAHKGLFRAIVERGMEHPQAMNTIFHLREELAAAVERALRARLGRPRNLRQSVRMMTQMVYGFLLTGVLNKRAPAPIAQKRTIDELAAAMTAYLEARAK